MENQMAQERTLNVDEIVLRKARQDRDQAQDLDNLIAVIIQLQKEKQVLQERVAQLEAKAEGPAE